MRRKDKVSFYGIFIFWLLFLQLPLAAYVAQEIPAAYQGRFRPADAYARLWLYDFCHSQSFDKTPALDLIWKLHVLGHSFLDQTRFFWLSSAQLKQQLGLDPHRSRFSYAELMPALTNSKSLLSKIAAYHFLKRYADPLNRSYSEKLELPQLAPGLWVSYRGNDLVLASSVNRLPWNTLKTGDILAFQTRDSSQFLRDHRKLSEEFLDLWAKLERFSALKGSRLKEEETYIQHFLELKKQNVPPKEIMAILEREHPLFQRLRLAGPLLQVLPSRHFPEEWYSLHALKVQLYDQEADALVPIRNFTKFSDEDFEQIRTSYMKWEQDLLQGNDNRTLWNLLNEQLFKAHQPRLGASYLEARGKTLTYPSAWQLKLERIYYQYPFIPFILLLYGTAAFLFILSLNLNNSRFHQWAFFLICLAFLAHTLLLAARSYILERPPVSNMFETVIYVPWIAVLCGLILRFFFKNSLILLAASLTSIILLILLEVTHLNHHLENVQAVLDSQFWLIIHVLMVVGSYGVFILGGVLGHFYLASFIWHRQETSSLAFLAKLILQILYLGTTMLISGTILGGIWAAESWGRFWDWDPKESWAFISSCLYLFIIHAFRFQKIGHFGLAAGAILGLLAISFTWYGVNYILGTGLHSYGFGSGGELFYYLFLIVEFSFLLLAYGMKKKIKKFKLTS
jgi:ABC-type transport system involved in cytochrome c biogenesis permease subunit